MTDGVLVVEAESAERAVTVAGDARDVQVLVVNSQRVVSVSPGIRTPAAAVARILATPHTFSLTPGETQALTVVTKDVDGATLTGRAITYESADPSIATVDEDGLVTGVGAGVLRQDDVRANQQQVDSDRAWPTIRRHHRGTRRPNSSGL